MRILITIALAGGTAGCGPLGPSPAAAGYGLTSAGLGEGVVPTDCEGTSWTVRVVAPSPEPARFTPKAGRHHGTGGPAERVELSIQCPSP